MMAEITNSNMSKEEKIEEKKKQLDTPSVAPSKIQVI